jgi:hypothetical protein
VEHHDHVGMDAPGTILRFEPPRVFEHTWWDDGSQPGAANSIQWELDPARAGTRLVLRHRFTELEGAQGSMAGWHICLDVLEHVLRGGDPRDHAPPQGRMAGTNFTQTRPGRGRWLDHEKLEAEYQRAIVRRRP